MPPTDRQLSFIEDLLKQKGMDPVEASERADQPDWEVPDELTVPQASEMIDWLWEQEDKE